MNLWSKIVRDEKKEIEPGEGKIPTPPTPEPPPAPVQEKPEDYGYDTKPPEEPKTKEEPAPPKEKTPEPKAPEKVEAPATGYDEKPPEVKEDDPPAPPKKDDPPDEIEKHLGDGLPKEEIQKIKEFAKAHEMTEKQIKAYGDLRRSELKEAEAAYDKAVKEDEKAQLKQRADWHNELKKDPVFGGEKFGDSILKVEKVLHDYFPEFKKILTDRKGMMPPYLMRDLAKLADHIHKTEKLVTGDPPAPPKPQETKDGKMNPLDYYT